MSKSVKPTGLSIARNGTAFTASWKCGDKNYSDGQQFNKKINSGSWSGNAVQAGTRSIKFWTYSAENYYPYAGKPKLTSVSVRVRGNRGSYTKKGKSHNPGWSAWETETLTLQPPYTPKSLTTELTATNQTTFTWQTDTSTSGNRPFHDVKWESILVKESNETDGSKLAWNSSNIGWLTNTGGASANRAVTEDSTLLAAASYTRWFRVCSRGPAGAKGWRYAKHVYATPYKAVMGDVSATTDGTNTDLTAKWTMTWTQAHPIDSTKVQYGIGVPATGMAVPSGIQAQDITTSVDVSGAAAWHGQITDAVEEDQCLWVRVATIHDANEAYSDWALAQKGPLKAPGTPSVTLSTQAVVTATNNSTVPDAHLAVVYKSDVTDPVVIGIITNGSSSVTVPYPDDGGSQQIVGVYAFQGEYTQTTRADGVYAYSITPNMVSETVWMANTLPSAPTNVSASIADTQGEVILTWDWTWTNADVAELSWSQNPNAWESTDEPDTYELDNSHAARWRISDLETGVKWYFRVRLGLKSSNDITYGPYSTTVSVDLASAPSVPTLTLDKAVATESDTLVAKWGYITTDGTSQAYAEICLVTISGTTYTYGDVLARADTAQRIDLSVSDLGWTTGTTYSLSVRVVSASGQRSDWSDPVSVTIAEPVTCTITNTSLQTITLTDDDSNTRTVTALTVMPLTATITGADVTGTTRLTIERDADYTMERPDESKIFSYKGELVTVWEQIGEDQITIDIENLIGPLDDGAQYKLTATVTDDYGQSDSAEIPFEVHWTNQAIVPEGEVWTDDYNYIVQITPVAPDGWVSGDVCDIYRLSADRPVLIVKDAAFGTTYVDPYPAFGQTGGHRIVYRTANGDYITADGTMAWIDLDLDDNDYLPVDKAVIDFDGERVEMEHNLTTSHSWEKDFLETTYLGGSVQGDWNPATHRKASVKAVLVMPDDLDTIEAMRRLATYTGICNVRTPDGSSFAADVQVSEDRGYDSAGKVVSFNLSITRVDPEEPDGVTLAEWEV
jgi:hypothetical protein